jgi:two-component system sensor histidine kinase MprB
MSPVRTSIVCACAAVLVTVLLAWHMADAIELPVRDAAMRMLPKRVANVTVIVAIDENSLRMVSWPWSRDRIAQIVDRASDAGAKGIVIDVLLAEARSGDEQLARSLRRLPSVLVSAIDERGVWLLPVAVLRDAASVAHGNFELDHDGIMRRVAATKQTRDRSLSAICIEAAAMLRPTNVPVGQTVAPAFRTPPSSIPLISAVALLSEPALAGSLRGKIVFVGPTALALGDRVLTPVSTALPDPGVMVHAAATESLLRGETIREIPPVGGGLIAAVAVALVAHGRNSRARRLSIAAAFAFAILGGGVLLLATTGYAIPFVVLVATVLMAAAAAETASVAATLRQSRAAASRIESRLGMARQSPEDVGPRLDQIAARLAELRTLEAESKRVLAHELKTPLASMRGLTQLLAGFTLSDAERSRVASLLESEAGKLQSMVTALLDLERLPLRDFETAANVVDLSSLVRSRVDFLQASTTRRLIASCEEGVLVRGEASLIERSVDNLVSNALKYTTGAVDVVVRSQNGSALLDVEDEGPGLSDSDRERVFQRFFRASSAAGTDGLGLGLALVAEIARWHGGSVSVERASNGGSSFRISFPLVSEFANAGAM